MILYILRFSLSIAIVFGFYKVFLEKERTFIFNRIFLLSGLIVSLIVPLISFSGTEEFKIMLNSTQQTINESIFQWESIINVTYGLITSVLLVRFGWDTRKLIMRIRAGELKIVDGAKVILSDQKEPPYAFLNYVFINKTQFDDIHTELIKHEIAHVEQGHTLDILIIELIKTILWINPMLGMFKSSMQLNHEFLADNYAIAYASSTAAYQNMLLSYLLVDEPANIVSGFNFSLTKKRLMMITKPASKIQRLKQLMTIPIIVLLFWACSDNEGVSGKEMLQYWRYTANMEEVLRTGTMNEADLKEGIIQPIKGKAQYDELVNIYNRMSTTQKESVYELPPYMTPIEE